MCMFFCFVKQKTAYEMRISDWSSDVCSSDLNSPGGVITAGMSIYDTMKFIKPDVSTMCVGQAASMGAFLLSAGAKGKRFALPNARVMIHQPSGGAQGQASDIEIQDRKSTRLNSSH